MMSFGKERSSGTEVLAHLLAGMHGRTDPSTQSTTFSGALQAMKEGRRVQREHWAEQIKFVCIEKGDIHFADDEEIPTHISSIHRNLFDISDQEGTRFPSFSLVMANGGVLNGWLPTLSDLLADDWQVL